MHHVWTYTLTIAGIAQNMVPIESITVKRGRKFSIDDVDTTPIERCFGMVTDVKSWRFLEHTQQWDS